MYRMTNRVITSSKAGRANRTVHRMINVLGKNIQEHYAPIEVEEERLIVDFHLDLLQSELSDDSRSQSLGYLSLL